MLPLEKAAMGFSATDSLQIRQRYRSLETLEAREQAVYMYLNMTQFFPHQVVAREGAVRELPFAGDDEMSRRIGDVQVSTNLGRLSVNELMLNEAAGIQGLIVLHRGRIVYERYPGMRPEDTHVWWSTAKTLAGTVAAMLVEEGLLDPTRPVEHYLPEFAQSGWCGTTVQDIADHSSGINAEELDISSYLSEQSELSRLIVSECIIDPADGRKTFTHNDALLSMTRKRPAGVRFEYSSANTNMLALLIERLTGKRYSDVLSERIWSRVGAEGDGQIGLSPQGEAVAHGMFSSRLRDLARFGLAFTPSGHRAHPIVSAKVLSMIQNGGRTAPYLDSVKRSDFLHWFGEAPVSCSWQWDAVFGDGDLYKGGFHGQALYVSPGRDLVTAFFSTSNERAQGAYLRPIARIFTGS